MLTAMDRLTAETGQGLLRFLEGCRGPDGVIRREAFRAEDLRNWLGAIAIHQWDPDRGDYVYRLFGTYLAQNLGRDLTGLTLAAWPPLVARIMRDQADIALQRQTVVVSHYRLRVFRRQGVVENAMRIQEKLVVPIAYSTDGPPDAVLVHVDQEASDVPLLRAYMEATQGSCWCAADRPLCDGCPVAGAP